MGAGMDPFVEYKPGARAKLNITDDDDSIRMLSENDDELRNLAKTDPFSVDNANDTFCIWHDLGELKTPARIINNSKMACIAPPTFNDITVTGVDLTLNNQNPTDDDVPYYYYKPPKIYDMDPKEGPTKGGTVAHIYAGEFKKNKHIVCIWNL